MHKEELSPRANPEIIRRNVGDSGATTIVRTEYGVSAEFSDSGFTSWVSTVAFPVCQSVTVRCVNYGRYCMKITWGYWQRREMSYREQRRVVEWQEALEKQGLKVNATVW